MKIAFISTPIISNIHVNTKNYIMPLGIMYLASYLEQRGHQIKIIDTARSQDINLTKKEISEFKPDLIGVSGIITAFKFIKKLIPELKSEFPTIPVVIGGHVVLDNYKILLQETKCDYTITGYGEKPIAYLVEYLENKRSIDTVPSLSYIDNHEIIHNPQWTLNDIDNIPYPSYHLIDMEYYLTIIGQNAALDMYLKKTGKPIPPSNRFAIVIGARGCTDKCSFCVHEFEHRGFYVHSMDYVIGNIKILYEQYGVRVFAMGEDLFFYNKKHTTDFINAMNENFPDAYFYGNSRADFIVNNKLIDILKNSNCFRISYGFESGSNEILKVLNKRVNRDTNIAAYKAFSETDIIPGVSFMVGSPGENHNTIQETIDAIYEGKITAGGAFITTPYPGSRLFKMCIDLGLITDVNKYLDEISNRDAITLSVNLTPYPDIIIRLMRYKIMAATDNVRIKEDKSYKITLHNLIIYHWITPIIYNSYFIYYGLKNTLLNKKPSSHVFNTKKP